LARPRALAVEHGPVEVALIIEIVHHARRGLDEVQADAELALEPPQIDILDAGARPKRPGELTVEARLVPARRAREQRTSFLFHDVGVAPRPPEIVVRQDRGKKLSRNVSVPERAGAYRCGDRQGPVDHLHSSVSAVEPMMPASTVIGAGPHAQGRPDGK